MTSDSQTDSGGVVRSTALLCVSCRAPVAENEAVCKLCCDSHPIARRLYELFCSEQVIPQPWTSWYWDDAMAKTTWGLALKCAEYLKTNNDQAQAQPPTATPERKGDNQ